jgi:parvulin-like peptidyl-prolyl isomerase
MTKRVALAALTALAALLSAGPPAQGAQRGQDAQRDQDAQRARRDQDAREAQEAKEARAAQAARALGVQADQTKGRPARPRGGALRTGGPAGPGGALGQDDAGPEATKDPEEPLFRIGDKIYREKDFLGYLPFMMPPSRVDQARRDERMLAEARKAYADHMLFMTRALKDGADKSPEYQDRLAGLAKYLLADEARKNLPTVEGVQPTDEQMEAYYEQNIANYRVDERASARQILVRVPPGKDGEAKGMDAIKKAVKELKAGKGWPDVAKKYSEDPGSKDRGGLIENFDPARMVPEFAAAVRGQEKGELGQPFRSTHGYHVVLVESLSPARPMTFDEAKARVRNQLSGRMLQDARAAFMDSLRADLGFSDTDFEVPEPEPPPAAEGRKGNKLRAQPLPPSPQQKRTGGTGAR